MWSSKTIIFLFLLLSIYHSVYTQNTVECDSCDPNCDTKADCSYNPDQFLDVPQMIRRHGYPSESHVVESGDGYLLRLHRIPGSKDGRKGGQPVFLQHGLLGSSADWLMNENNSLGYVLADQGYDVWLGNARGNLYSKGHIFLSIDSPKYWNFSWHEMGTQDLPAVLYFISNTTNKPGEIIYIGHSMGTTTFFVLSSTLPQVAKNVKVMVALAPVAYMTHIKSPIRYLSPFVYDFQWLAKYLGVNQFLPNNKIIKLLAYECELFKLEERICENLIFCICGFNKKTFNENVLSLVLSHDPAGTSTSTVLHYAQEIKNEGQFQWWDYGSKGNMIQYGQLTPPEYKLHHITRPIYLMYAKNDVLASYIDVQRLSKSLTNLAGMYLVPNEDFGHVDFIFGKQAELLVYQPLLTFLRNY